MSQDAKESKSVKGRILVAGDVCLDVVSIPVPAPAAGSGKLDNWQQTGEVRTNYLPGGAFLLAEFIQASCPEHDVRAPIPGRPDELASRSNSERHMSMKEFLSISERLTRDEIVHSLLRLGVFKENPDSKEANTIRLSESHGFSGPAKDDPSLKILPPGDPDSSARIVVLDDTGNRFRRSPDQWPTVVDKPATAEPPVFIYKLHRPLPTGMVENKLWNAIMANHADRCIVVISVDDLREIDAPINRGLSWERTVLDLVWQLLNTDALKPLRDCPHLVVRLGLDGTLYWHREKEDEYYAWIVYDPNGIEGAGAGTRPGKMVGYASVFTASMTRQIADAGPIKSLSCEKDDEGKLNSPPEAIINAIKRGLIDSRRLLEIGFGRDILNPCYPKEELFEVRKDNESFFACQSVPIIHGASVPDRGYWRLIESLFSDKPDLLHRAVSMSATGAEPHNTKDIERLDKEDRKVYELLRQVPIAKFGKGLRAIDRCEIENYRALYDLMCEYTAMLSPPRPLSIAVFGPPGAGKSYGIKMVAKALENLEQRRPIEPITFNLSQYQRAEELADAFHLVRDRVLSGKMPLVFFDEFDTSLAGKPLGWLRYFLSPMQDGEFLDRGTPHPIGQAIFVFAGGTCGSYAEFAKPVMCVNPGEGDKEVLDTFRKAKGPDFLSRLRATLDIPGLDLQTDFDPYGPVEKFPSEPAILLRRANILAYQLKEKAPHLCDSKGVLNVSPSVLRALLHLPKFVHGNRSFEAMLDMSHFQNAEKFTPALLPASVHTELHASASQLAQLLSTDYPFRPKERELIARKIHEYYVKKRKSDPECKLSDPALRDWDDLSKDESGQKLQRSNLEQADHIAVKLRSVGLWFRKIIRGMPVDLNARTRIESKLLELAQLEHKRWIAEKRKAGWIAASDNLRASRCDRYLMHNALFPWDKLSDEQKKLDLDTVQNIPDFLAAAEYEIIQAEPEGE